jgi:hypothetical protein
VISDEFTDESTPLSVILLYINVNFSSVSSVREEARVPDNLMVIVLSEFATAVIVIPEGKPAIV